MLNVLESFFKNANRLTVSVITVALTLSIGWLDLITGVEIQFMLIYLLPIFLGSWFVSREMGVGVALLSSLIWFVLDRVGNRNYSSEWIVYWNLLMRSGVFVVFALTQTQLRGKVDELSRLAARDLLTGLPNAQAFIEIIADETVRALPEQPMTFACIDVIGIDWINGRFGYPAGDQMLCTVAETIRARAPRPDLLGRTGGTSFSLLLPNTSSEQANAILQDIHEALQEERRKYSHPLTFYVSAVACPESPKTIAQLLHQADTQMDRMKGGKKDTIQIARSDNVAVLN